MTDPIPTKFEEAEWAAILLLSRASGIKSRSEIIRRCVRMLAAEVKRRGPNWNWVKETSRPLNIKDFAEENPLAAEDPAAYHATDADDAARLLAHARAMALEAKAGSSGVPRRPARTAPRPPAAGPE